LLTYKLLLAGAAAWLLPNADALAGLAPALGLSVMTFRPSVTASTAIAGRCPRAAGCTLAFT
jgi:hypothetical protein